MTHRALVYDQDDNMEVTPKPDLTKIICSNYAIADIDINTAASGSVDFAAASYTSIAGFISKVSSHEFVVQKAGVYKVETYLSSAANTTAEIEVSILKNSNNVLTPLAKSIICSARNAYLFAVDNFAVDDIITIHTERVGVDASQVLIQEKHCTLLLWKIG